MLSKPNSEYVAVPVAAEILGVSVSFLNKLRCYGGGPRFQKVGGRIVRYNVVALRDWAESAEPTFDLQFQQSRERWHWKNAEGAPLVVQGTRLQRLSSFPAGSIAAIPQPSARCQPIGSSAASASR